MLENVRHLGARIQRENFQEEPLRLPNLGRLLRKCPLSFQVLALAVNMIIIVLFCWKYEASFFGKNDMIDTDTMSSGNANEANVLAYFPDIEEEWIRWCVFIFIEFCAVLDFFSSFSYLKTLLGCSCCEFFSYSKFCSPTYSLLVAFQSLWLQQVSLSCANSDPIGNLLNFSSGWAGFQSGTMIFCGVLSIWLKIAESGLWGCIRKSSNKKLKTALKFISALFQILNFVVSLIIWIGNVKDMTFDGKWFILIFFPFWLFLRILEYIINIWTHEQQAEEGEGSTDQRRTSEPLIEMNNLRNQTQPNGERHIRHEDHNPLSQFRSHLDDTQRLANDGQRYRSPSRFPLSYNQNF